MKNTQQALSSIFQAIPADRRIGGARMVEALIEDRQRLHDAKAAVRGLYPFRDEVASTRALDRFCSALAAYAALSHLGVFRCIAEARERRSNVREVAVVVYPSIERSTEEILRFVDRHRGVNPLPAGKSVTRALSAVNRNLNPSDTSWKICFLSKSKAEPREVESPADRNAPAKVRRESTRCESGNLQAAGEPRCQAIVSANNAEDSQQSCKAKSTV